MKAPRCYIIRTLAALLNIADSVKLPCDYLLYHACKTLVKNLLVTFVQPLFLCIDIYGNFSLRAKDCSL